VNPPYGLKLVKYYGGTAKAEKRRVHFKEDGRLFRAVDDSLFDTGHLETCASGNGWAIFVVSPEGKMYAHKHVEGEYHHSTFLSGSAVMAAGELLVVQGVVRVINAKSGHYLPLPENMHNFVLRFPNIPRDAIILPNFKSNPTPAYTVAEYKFSGAPKSVKRARLEAKLSAAADNPKARAWINRVAA